MLKLNKTSLPLTITRNGIEHILLSPIERIGLNAERMGISVIKVNVRTAQGLTIKDIKEGMYHGVLSTGTANGWIRRIKNINDNFYYYYDKSYSHMEKEIRYSA